eukprot:CAMPEP_0168255996 /NCGR_PEP_ID=MMETSP0141_2-20121125/5583_1 /TAXON_ID=44445 /ORGANISM="Pseudo-nitzschia australis, Strain 10249 10 AB" /LENGTH=60 /DNA_ID=CAMNT_0008192595 /DNA_START=269 /DNA_END=448 /DNA_ORIENTATION=-
MAATNHHANNYNDNYGNDNHYFFCVDLGRGLGGTTAAVAAECRVQRNNKGKCERWDDARW